MAAVRCLNRTAATWRAASELISTRFVFTTMLEPIPPRPLSGPGPSLWAMTLFSVPGSTPRERHAAVIFWLTNWPTWCSSAAPGPMAPCAASPAPAKVHFTVTPAAPMDIMAWRVFVCTQILDVDAATAARYASDEGLINWTGRQTVTQADVGKSIPVSVDADLYRRLRSGAGAVAGAASAPEGAARTAEFNTLPAAEKERHYPRSRPAILAQDRHKTRYKARPIGG